MPVELVFLFMALLIFLFLGLMLIVETINSFVVRDKYIYMYRTGKPVNVYLCMDCGLYQSINYHGRSYGNCGSCGGDRKEVRARWNGIPSSFMISIAFPGKFERIEDEY